jgi:hypothetical protein
MLARMTGPGHDTLGNEVCVCTWTDRDERDERDQ